MVEVCEVGEEGEEEEEGGGGNHKTCYIGLIFKIFV